jgi:hypothetical protein
MFLSSCQSGQLFKPNAGGAVGIVGGIASLLPGTAQ